MNNQHNPKTLKGKLDLIKSINIDLENQVEINPNDLEQINYQLTILQASIIQAKKYLETFI